MKLTNILLSVVCGDMIYQNRLTNNRVIAGVHFSAQQQGAPLPFNLAQYMAANMDNANIRAAARLSKIYAKPTTKNLNQRRFKKYTKHMQG